MDVFVRARVASLTCRAVLGPRSHDGLDRSTYLRRPDLYLILIYPSLSI
jgi:hypothetical protein